MPATVTPTIRGTDIKVTLANKTFISHEGATILANRFTAVPQVAPALTPLPTLKRPVWPFIAPRSSSSASVKSIPESRFTNHGTLTVDDLNLSRDDIINSGLITADTLALQGGNFHNQTKGRVQVRRNTTFDLEHRFLNDGEFSGTGGTFTQTQGRIENNGTWDHQGNIDLGTASIENCGTLNWKGGTLKAASRWNIYWNHGTWVFDGMTSVWDDLQIGNFGTVHLKDSALDFKKFLNYKTLILSSGKYHMDTLKSDHLISFQDNDWVFTDALTYKWLVRNDLPAWRIYNQLMVKELELKGDIESQQTLWYDVAPLPKDLRSQGDITFSSFFSYCRTLDMLHRIQATGTVKLFVNNIQVSRNHEFGTIGHLYLYVQGSFTNPGYLFTAPILTFYIYEEFIGGTDNAHMGTVAATQGPLTLTAAGIDARFARIYGKGQSRLEAMGAWRVSKDKKKEVFVKVIVDRVCNTGEAKLDVINGDIWVGDKAQGTGVEPHLGNHTYAVQNGAYVASDSRLTLKAARDILIDYGQVISNSWVDLEAPRLIRNLAGLVATQGPVFIQGKEYTHTRAPLVSVGRHESGSGSSGRWYNRSTWSWSRSWTDVYPGSGPATLNATSNVYLRVRKVNNVSSTILSGGKIEMQHKALRKKTTGYIETAQGCSHNSSPWVLPCTVQSAQAIRINMGDVAISGTMNSPVIKIQATGTGLFTNASRSRSDTVPARTPLLNLTHYIFEQTKIPGLYIQEQQPNGLPLVRTTFSIGNPTITPAGACLPLIRDGNSPSARTPGPGAFSFNPHCSLDLAPFFQQLLCQNMGKAFILDAHGNRRSGKDLLGTLFANTQHYSEKNNKNSITALDLETLPYAILLYELQQIGRQVQHNTLVALPACEVNPYKSSGDMSGDDISLTTGSQIHQNNRIAAKKKLEVVSTHGPISRTTGKYSVVRHIDNGHIVQEIAMPQQTFSCDQGDVKVCAYEDLAATGTLTKAGGNITEISQTGNDIKNQLTLATTTTTSHRKSGGWFGSDKHWTQSSTSHTFVPNTAIANRNLCEQAAKTIYLTGAQEVGKEQIRYQAQALKSNAAIAVGYNEVHAKSSGLFGSKSSSSYEQTATVAKTKVKTKNLVLETAETAFKGTDIDARKVDDQTQNIVLGMNTQELHSHSTASNRSMIGYSKMQRQAGWDVGVPTTLKVGEWVSHRGADLTATSTLTYDSALTTQPMESFECRKDFKAQATPLRQWEEVQVKSGGLSNPGLDLVTKGTLPIGNSYAELGKGDGQDQVVAGLRAANETLEIANNVIKMAKGDASGFLASLATVTLGTQTVKSSCHQVQEQAPVLQAQTVLWHNDQTHLKGHYGLGDATILTDQLSSEPMTHTAAARQQYQAQSVGVNLMTESVSFNFGTGKAAESHTLKENTTVRADSLFVAAWDAHLKGTNITSTAATTHISGNLTEENEADTHTHSSSFTSIGVTVTMVEGVPVVSLGDYGYGTQKGHQVTVTQAAGLKADQVYTTVGGTHKTISATHASHVSHGEEVPSLTLEDGTVRYVQPMPAVDNNCGFFGLLTGQADVDLRNPRLTAVNRLVDALGNPALSVQVSALLAPEIQELLHAGQLDHIPGAATVAGHHTQAQLRLDEAMRIANSALGTTGLDAPALLTYTGKDEDVRYQVQDAVRQALEAQKAHEAEAIAWAHDPETIRAFLQTVVAQPGWSLGYASEHFTHLQGEHLEVKPSGVMDAIPLVFGLNLKIYRAANDNQGDNSLTLVHDRETSPDAATVELIHQPYKQGKLNNHFDRLQPAPSQIQATHTVTETIQEVNNHSKTKLLLPFGTVTSLFNNAREFQKLTSQKLSEKLHQDGYQPEEIKQEDVKTILSELDEEGKELEKTFIAPSKKKEKLPQQSSKASQETITPSSEDVYLGMLYDNPLPYIFKKENEAGYKKNATPAPKETSPSDHPPTFREIIKYGENAKAFQQPGHATLQHLQVRPPLKEGQTECYSAPFKKQRRNSWPIIRTTFEKAREAVIESAERMYQTRERFVESGYDVRTLSPYEIAGVVNCYALDGIGALAKGFDTLTLGTLSAVGEAADQVKDTASTGVRRTVRHTTGNARLGQNLGDLTYLGLSMFGSKGFNAVKGTGKSTGLIDKAGETASHISASAAKAPKLPLQLTYQAGGEAFKGQTQIPQVVLNNQAGKSFQLAVHNNLLIPQNNQTYYAFVHGKGTVGTIPDLPTLYGVTDIKNVKYISFSKQLKAQAALAKQQGTSFNLIISPGTERISVPLVNAIIRSEGGGKIFEFNPVTQMMRERVLDGNKVIR